MKTEDTLKYNIEKYSHYKKFVETDNNFEVPDELAFMRPFIKTDEEKKWLESHYNDQNALRFVIDTKEDGAVGVLTLTDIDWKNRRAEIGAKLASKGNRSKGYGTDAVMAIMRYAFDELGFHRLDASRLAMNQVSEHLLVKCGFVEEGVKRNYIYKGGKYRDLVEAGILADEYYTLINKNHYWEK